MAVLVGQCSDRAFVVNEGWRASRSIIVFFFIHMDRI